MKNKNRWVTMALVNLALLALAGMLLRTKFLFPIPEIDYRHLLSAHSHFAFGGWVTLILMVLFLDSFLTPAQSQKKVYGVMLWGIQLTSLGMLFSFPFQGYGLFSTTFSTLFIFFTYGFAWVFIKDSWKNKMDKPVLLLSTVAMIFLVVSSAGPFSLAYMMSTHTGNANTFRDSVYYYLHFQYNGFFTLSVLALLFNKKIGGLSAATKKRMYWFAWLLCISVPPSFFLSLLWHHYNLYLHILAFIGCGMIVIALAAFVVLVVKDRILFSSGNRLARNLLTLSMASFVIKMVLQTGTVFHWLANAVFSFRPIIIGFLHLVFLGLVSFYILSHLIEAGLLRVSRLGARLAVLYFSAAIIINESILLVNGVGLMFRNTNPIYGWLLWGASILLFTGAVSMVATRMGEQRQGLEKDD